MNGDPIAPGWARLAILLLWGLASALDQPPTDAAPSPAPAIDRAVPAEGFVRLRCNVDPDEPRVQPPPIILVTVHETQGDRHRQSVRHSRFLRCVVIDE